MAEVVVPVVVLVRQTICQAITMSLEDTQIHSVCSLILFACCLPFFLLKKCWLSRTVKPFQIQSSKVFHHLQTVLQNQWLIWFWQQPGYASLRQKVVLLHLFQSNLNLRNCSAWKMPRSMSSGGAQVQRFLWGCEVGQGGPKFANVRRFVTIFFHSAS